MAKSSPQTAAASTASSAVSGASSTASGRPIRYIATDKQLRKVLDESDGKFTYQSLSTIGLEFLLLNKCSSHKEQHAPCVIAIAIASESPKFPAVFLMVQNLNKQLLSTAFKKLWADSSVVKVVHAVERPAKAWFAQFGSSLMATDPNASPVKTVDLQSLFERVIDSTCIDVTIAQFMKTVNPQAAKRDMFVSGYAAIGSSNLSSCTQALSLKTQQQLAQNAQALASLYYCLRVLPLPVGDKNACVADKSEWKIILSRVTQITSERCATAANPKATLNGTAKQVAEQKSRYQPVLSSDNPTTSKPSNTASSNQPPFPSPLPNEPTMFNSSIKPIATNTQLQNFLIENRGRLVIGNPQVIGIDFLLSDSCHEHTNSNQPCLAGITIASDSQAYPAVILLVQNLYKTLLVEAFLGLWSDNNVTKVMFGVRRAAMAWHAHFGSHLVDFDCGVRPNKTIDLQLLVESVVDSAPRDASVAQMANWARLDVSSQHFAASGFSFVSKSQPHDVTSVESCEIRALGPHIQQRLVQNAQLFAAIYEGLRMVPLPLNAPNASVMDAGAWRSKLRQVTQMTADRCANAVDNNGIPSIWFDKASDYEPRSLECLVPRSSNDSDKHVTEDDDDSLPLHRLELQCEIDSLLAILPRKYREAVMRVENYRECLVDVCLDVGRVPYVYVGKRKRVPLEINHQSSRSGWDVLINNKRSPDEVAASKLVTKQDIDKILELLGGETRIGGDNRAGIDAQLHRVSVMRSKTKEIYGVTLRVGRALIHAASALSDLLLSTKHREKSVLLLGHPGSGKTTLIRDVARCISETQENVCIIDTSNEIGGDGLVPHACIGWARRMMVPSLELQASVMVECVQNHTVETMVIDEIGRKAEVSAASTVRQRGPRLVASAHGDFHALMKNADLKGLLGGTQQVIMSASEVKEQKLDGKLRTERAGSPVFDVIVELDRETPGLCHIIWDVAAAVDCVLSGKPLPKVESRCWNSSTRGVQVLSS